MYSSPVSSTKTEVCLPESLKRRKNTECVGADKEDNGGRGQWRHEDLLSGEGKQEGLQRSQEFLLV